MSIVCTIFTKLGIRNPSVAVSTSSRKDTVTLFLWPELGDMPTKRGKRGRSSSNAPRKSKEASITASKNNTDGRNFANSDKTAVGIFVENF